MTAVAAAASESRIIRVFLSSTFRDFMGERDLLVKQVFPELRRKARERGVEVVEVDLRWGITEEESRQGKVIPICLGEIDRCRPYFVGMLGERYGWIPPADQYSTAVIERQPWLRQHLGGVSVTELEILHGVLNDPAVAGRAFFYFRDPAWSNSQSKQGFVCETAEEEAKLTDLKQRIRTSGFTVAENLPDPKSLADQIGRDLWELIEQQYPDLDEANALKREERQHASYRRSRLGVYLGGKRSINQLERWIDAGQQKILITGESGAGKSALIANWIEAHQQNHPEDMVFAHHLGCSNDASTIRPLLARLIDTAKQQLPEVYGFSLSVPQDWWELVAKVVEALQSLGRWAQQKNHRWIWVLDGLDRFAPDDQKALPWLPLTIPEGVVIVASALECPAREILLERQFKTLTVGPLKTKEQAALIQQYLGRYTKQLIAELRQSILSHPLAGSPLFLRVLLEELRQCGRYETLAEQLAGYLSAETIDDLYERVLERLEADGNGENVCKVMTALWASRAGLSEEELLAITGLKPLQWAPIDLALEEALGRNGNRLVFDHDYLRKAVESRYQLNKENQRAAHGMLADWYGAKEERDERRAEEMPWQLLRSHRLSTLKELLLSPFFLIAALDTIGTDEIWHYWDNLESELLLCMEQQYASMWDDWSSRNSELSIGLITDALSQLFMHAGKHGDFAVLIMHTRVKLKSISKLDIDSLVLAKVDYSELRRLRAEYRSALAEINSALNLAKNTDTSTSVADLQLIRGDILMCINDFDAAREAYNNAKEYSSSPKDDFCNVQLAWIEYSQGEYAKAAEILRSSYSNLALSLGRHHIWTTQASNNMALAIFNKGDISEALPISQDSWHKTREQLGLNHWVSRLEQINHAWILHAYGSTDEAQKYYDQAYQSFCLQLGESHPLTALALCSKGWHETTQGNYGLSTSFLNRAMTIMKETHGDDHPDMAVPLELLSWNSLFEHSPLSSTKLSSLSISLISMHYGEEHPNTILPMAVSGAALLEQSKIIEALDVMLRAKEIAFRRDFQRTLDFAQLLVCEAKAYMAQGDSNKASIALTAALGIRQERLPEYHHDILIINQALGCACNAESGAALQPPLILDALLKFKARRFCGSSTM